MDAIEMDRFSKIERSPFQDAISLYSAFDDSMLSTDQEFHVEKRSNIIHSDRLPRHKALS